MPKRKPPPRTRTEQLARVVESTGDATDRELAALLRRHPLPWKLDTGLSVGTIPAIRRTLPRRANMRYYETFSSEDIRTLCRAALRYATLIAASELPAQQNPKRKRGKHANA